MNICATSTASGPNGITPTTTTSSKSNNMSHPQQKQQQQAASPPFKRKLNRPSSPPVGAVVTSPLVGGKIPSSPLVHSKKGGQDREEGHKPVHSSIKMTPGGVPVPAATPSSSSGGKTRYRVEQRGGNDKQVRFGSDGLPAAATALSQDHALPKQQPQHNYVSPSRSMSSHCTHKSTPEEDDDDVVVDNNIPSAVLEYKTFRSPDRRIDGATALLPSPTKQQIDSTRDKPNAEEKNDDILPSLCSSRSNSAGSPSSLAGNAILTPSPPSSSSNVPTLKKKITLAKMEKSKITGEERREQAGQDSVTAANAGNTHNDMKSSPLSPKSSSIATLHEDKARAAISDEKKIGDFDDEAAFDRELEHEITNLDVIDDFVPQTPRSNTRDHVSTPTDFLGKGGGKFDTSNVLAWLQSPTAHGLFSPGGGLGSLLNTPAGSGLPRTPRTPTVSTSFFFSDVASLPKNAGATDGTPKVDGFGSRTPKGGGTGSSSNIICISPLASTRNGGGGRLSMENILNANTPLDSFRDIFFSPKEQRKPLPLLGDTPGRTQLGDGKDDKKNSKSRRGNDPSLDAVHLAERDLMEDEDLSVLLQLAANTPGSKHPDGNSGIVFRSPPGFLLNSNDQDGCGDGRGGSLPNLELPMIGNDDQEDNGNEKNKSKGRLQKKTVGRNELRNDDYLPQLGMRSLSSHGSSGSRVGEVKTTKPNGNNNNDRQGSSVASNKNEKTSGPKPAASSTAKSGSNPPVPSTVAAAPSLSSANPYHLAPPPYPADLAHAYYSMSGMPNVPPNSSGSMRVVVGGHPPPRRHSTGGTTAASNAKNGGVKSGETSPTGQGLPLPQHPAYHEYPPAAHRGSLPPYPPTHPSMYASYSAYSRYPPYSHYPPPMPVYNTQKQKQPPKQPPKQRAASITGSTAAASQPIAKASKENAGGNKRATTKSSSVSKPTTASNGNVNGKSVSKPATSANSKKRSSPSSATLPLSSSVPASESGSVSTSTMKAANTGSSVTDQPSANTPPTTSPNKKLKKSPGDRPNKKKNKSPSLTDRGDRDKAAATIHSVNQASGGKNDKAAALAAAILRGVTMRPSGKWQAQLYFAGKSRYIGVFDTREKAALAYEIAREKLKSGGAEAGALTPKSTENLVNTARKAAFDGVNERLPK